MTGIEIGNKLEMELDKLTSFTCPSFISEEKNYFLNKAYASLIVKKFLGDTPNKQGFEANLRRSKELSSLSNNIVYKSPLGTFGTSNLMTLTSNLDGTELVIMPTMVTVKVENEEVMRLPAEVINRSFIDKVLITDKNKYVYLDACPVVFSANKIAAVYFDAVIANKYSNIIFTTLQNEKNCISMTATAICKKEIIDVDSTGKYELLDEEFYNEVIATAATYMLDNIESPRVQTQSQLTSQLE